jgi:hypothetical protein
LKTKHIQQTTTQKNFERKRRKIRAKKNLKYKKYGEFDPGSG